MIPKYQFFSGVKTRSYWEYSHKSWAFLPDNVIASRLQEEAQHERIITYCGGGFVATVNAMAHLMAGNENVSVYDSSMDEWAEKIYHYGQSRKLTTQKGVEFP